MEIEEKGEGRAHLDDAVLPRRRIERVLDVALADDSEVSDDVYRCRPQHVVVDIRERLRRRNDDRIARMNPQRVKILTTRRKNHHNAEIQPRYPR